MQISIDAQHNFADKVVEELSRLLDEKEPHEGLPKKTSLEIL